MEKNYKWIFPHVKGTMTTAGMMRMMLLALLPAEIFGVLHFGPRVLLHLLICVVTCTLTEFTIEAFRDKPLTVADGSAMVTGELLTLMLPANAPLWLGALGGLFAVGVIKMPFGGLGKNRLNPALSGYCFLFLAFPKYMKDYSFGSYGSRTLLGQLLSGQTVDPYPMLWGNTNGSIGTVSAAMLLLGAVLLLAFGIIHLRIPAAIGISFLITLFLGAGKGFDQLYFTTQFLGGGLILGAFFVATDCVTSPITRKGQIWYGVLIGVMTAALRLAGIEEGMVYAILVSNLCVPFIEQLTVPKPFGRRKPVQVTQNRRQP